MAAAQASYENAKSQWLQAAKEAQSQKEEAKAAYDSDKADGLTDASFTDWVSFNYPAFSAAYNNYEAAEAGYGAAFANVDSSGYREWQEKRQQELTPLFQSGDPDKTRFIIYTGEE